MKKDYYFIRFIIQARKPKTFIWDCENTHRDEKLGEVRWYPAWRRYCYFPTCVAVYSHGCLADIVAFLKQVNDEHQREWKK